MTFRFRVKCRRDWKSAIEAARQMQFTPGSFGGRTMVICHVVMTKRHELTIRFMEIDDCKRFWMGLPQYRIGRWLQALAKRHR